MANNKDDKLSRFQVICLERGREGGREGGRFPNFMFCKNVNGLVDAK